jgi:hypothetical protein
MLTSQDHRYAARGFIGVPYAYPTTRPSSSSTSQAWVSRDRAIRSAISAGVGGSISKVIAVSRTYGR